MALSTPSRFGDFEAESSFHLPMPGLLADLDSGSAAICMTDEFLEAPPLTRIRLMQQWMRGFRDLKDAATVDWFREWSRSRPEQGIVEQIDAFRGHCHDEGLAYPADLPILLQRY